jgi:hypothetical protein
MLTFTAILQKFDKKGEKTGWTYLEIPAHLAQELNPDTKTSYRVKGHLDEFPIKLVALLPMGDGGFIMPVNADMRKGIYKKEGASVKVAIEVDTDPLPLSADLLDCLADEPAALAFFNTLPKGHQNYYSKWIEDAKTTETKTKRITQAVKGLAMGLGYGEMIRYFKGMKEK